jgi:hypothetical protein
VSICDICGEKRNTRKSRAHEKISTDFTDVHGFSVLGQSHYNILSASIGDIVCWTRDENPLILKSKEGYEEGEKD